MLESDPLDPKVGRITPRITSKGSALVIDVVGRLGFDVHREFRQAYENQPQRFSRYAVNFKDCTQLDSTGLGMLLMLRDFSRADKNSLLLLHCPPEIRHVLSYASFEKLFTILAE